MINCYCRLQQPRDTFTIILVLPSFCFRVKSPYEKDRRTNGRTKGQGPQCGLFGRPHNDAADCVRLCHVVHDVRDRSAVMIMLSVDKTLTRVEYSSYCNRMHRSHVIYSYFSRRSAISLIYKVDMHSLRWRLLQVTVKSKHTCTLYVLLVQC